VSSPSGGVSGEDLFWNFLVARGLSKATQFGISTRSVFSRKCVFPVRGRLRGRPFLEFIGRPWLEQGYPVRHIDQVGIQ
jgi:hypothetical protein